MDICFVEVCQLGDGIAIRWLENPIFSDKEGREFFVHRMPTVFEKIPVVWVNRDGIDRADGVSYSDPATVKKHASCTQLGEIFNQFMLL